MTYLLPQMCHGSTNSFLLGNLDWSSRLDNQYVCGNVEWEVLPGTRNSCTLLWVAWETNRKQSPRCTRSALGFTNRFALNKHHPSFPILLTHRRLTGSCGLITWVPTSLAKPSCLFSRYGLIPCSQGLPCLHHPLLMVVEMIFVVGLVLHVSLAHLGHGQLSFATLLQLL